MIFLTGNEGNDTYVFGNGWGVDTINDSSGFDTLNLTAVTLDLTFKIGTISLQVFDKSERNPGCTAPD